MPTQYPTHLYMVTSPALLGYPLQSWVILCLYQNTYIKLNVNFPLIRSMNAVHLVFGRWVTLLVTNITPTVIQQKTEKGLVQLSNTRICQKVY